MNENTISAHNELFEKLDEQLTNIRALFTDLDKTGKEVEKYRDHFIYSPFTKITGYHPEQNIAEAESVIKTIVLRLIATELPAETKINLSSFDEYYPNQNTPLSVMEYATFIRNELKNMDAIVLRETESITLETVPGHINSINDWEIERKATLRFNISVDDYHRKKKIEALLTHIQIVFGTLKPTDITLPEIPDEDAFKLEPFAGCIGPVRVFKNGNITIGFRSSREANVFKQILWNNYCKSRNLSEIQLCH
jgi:hypothetical protein